MPPSVADSDHRSIQEIRPNPVESIAGTVEQVQTYLPETGWGVYRVQLVGGTHRGHLATVVGIGGDLRPGVFVAADGHWQQHVHHGAQFRADLIRLTPPSTAVGILRYLSSGIVKGIGPNKAAAIVKAFGEDTLIVIEKTPRRLLEVPGLSGRLMEAIVASWQEHSAVRDLMIFLQRYGIPASKWGPINKKYGAEASARISADPYILSRDIDGIGFLTADRVAKELGVPPHSMKRVAAGLIHALEELKDEGHSAGPRDLVLKHASKILSLGPAVVEGTLDHLISLGELESESVFGRALVYLPYMRAYERSVATILLRLASQDNAVTKCVPFDQALAMAEISTGKSLSESQRQALQQTLRHRLQVITGGPGSGKAQPLTEPILTPDGFRPIGDIRPGDMVVSEEGKPVRVKSVHPQGVKPVYRVTFRDGRSTLCCDEHLWKVHARTSVKGLREKGKTRDLGWQVVPLERIRAWLSSGRSGSARIAIPLATPFDGGGGIPIPGYVLGILLGSGDMSGKGIRFTTDDQDIADRISVLLAPLGYGISLIPRAPRPCSTYQITCRATGRRRNGLRQWLKEQCLCVRSWEKHVPECVFTAHPGVRREVLQGMLDSDGDRQSRRSGCFASTSKRLAEDLRRLAWSLGFVARIGPHKGGLPPLHAPKLEGRRCHRVHVAADDTKELFQRKQRARDQQPLRGMERRLQIMRIDPAGEAACVCIAVDSPTQLYVTRDYIVTHNTTILHTMLEMISGQNLKVVLCAPTGRAAKHMEEATGRPACTIHRLLEYRPKFGDFARNHRNPLDGDIFIVDESSMLDLALAYKLLRALPKHAQLILVGDVDQLPSVGAGSVLADIIQSGSIPVVWLREIFRQAALSSIIVSAHLIKQGQIPPTPNEPGDDFFFMKTKEPDDIKAKIVRMVTERIPAKLGIDPLKDIQVLAPMHKGPLGITEINKLLQRTLNARNLDGPKFAAGHNDYYIGDKVMQMKNDYDLDVFNGDVGFIRELWSEPGNRKAIIEFDDRRVEYPLSKFNELALAYCCSIHKGQGSEWPAVVIPMVRGYFHMLQKNLIYTGLTRGKRLVVMIGDKSALAIACRNNKANERFGGLRQRLAEQSDDWRDESLFPE